MREALYYEKRAGGEARCLLCPLGCRVAPGTAGRCLARRNMGGRLTAQSYGRLTSLALDPIEKKPLRRFRPGGFVLSVGSYGCNMRCPFCQNHEISMREAAYEEMSPEALARRSLERAERGNIGVAFTYNEPLIGYEFVLDTAKLIRAQGQSVVLVTNGFINEAPLRALLPYIDALNIDLKGFAEAYYARLGGRLADVRRSIAMSAASCHVEVTTLIVPGENDSPREMRALAAWLASVDKGIPLHISRFFPRWRMEDAEATGVEAIYELAEIARESLEHVYTGNC